MGVPGFFMWLWKRYKGNNFVFKKSSLHKDEDESLIKRIDNIDFLLIDTNCLLHPMCFQVLAEEQEKLRKLMKNTKVDIEKLEDKMMAICF
jgi:5'-3' exonuclease